MSDSHVSAPAMLEPRSSREAIRRGLKCRCPACGEGKLFEKYLRVSRNCPSCGEELYHHRADDGPAYLTILIVCHIAGFMLHGLFSWTDLSPAVVSAIIIAVIVPMSIAILPSAKGFMVAIQWANRMHGFGLAAKSAS